MENKLNIHMVLLYTLLVCVNTHTKTMEGYTDEDTFSAVGCGTQPAQYDEMDTADQPQQKLNNIVFRPFSNLTVSFPFLLHGTLPAGSTSTDSTIIIHSPSSALHLRALLEQWPSSSFLFLLPSPPLLFSSLRYPPLPSALRLKTHTQTDS